MTAALTLILFLAPTLPTASELPPPEALNELATAPAAWERFRFPDSATAEWALRFNQRFADNLGKERDQWPEERHQALYELVLRENEQLRRPWTALAWAQWDGTQWTPGLCDWKRRLRLKELRTLLGPEAWEAGEMPPVVPTWRFREMK